MFIDETAVIEHITQTFDGLDSVESDGNTFFFYDPKRDTPADHRFPFATLVTTDAYDQFSNLTRAGVYRLNIGVSRDTFERLLGSRLERSAAAEDPAAVPHDFTAVDKIMRHPVYGMMFWICVLNPSPTTFDAVVKPLLNEAYERAAGRLN